MSDLQCPVRFYLAPGDEVAALLPGLEQERIARVVAPRPDERQATAAAAELACGVTLLVSATGTREDLDDLADLHRGEAVLVLTDALDDLTLPARLDRDADGWAVHPWPAAQE